MSDTIAKIKTWVCPNCRYSQYYSPEDPRMDTDFAEARYAGRPSTACPACYAGENPQRIRGVYHLEVLAGGDLSLLGQRRVASDAVLEATLVPELDENGKPVMIQTGERYELRVNPDTGDIYSEAVPVYEPKMIPAPKQQVDELKLQRDQELDALASVAVKEIST